MVLYRIMHIHQLHFQKKDELSVFEMIQFTTTCAWRAECDSAGCSWRTLASSVGDVVLILVGRARASRYSALQLVRERKWNVFVVLVSRYREENRSSFSFFFYSYHLKYTYFPLL